MPATREEQGHNVPQMMVVLAAILAPKQHNGYLSRQILGPVSHHVGCHTLPLAPQTAIPGNNPQMTSAIGKDRKGGHCITPGWEKELSASMIFLRPIKHKALCEELHALVLR